MDTQREMMKATEVASYLGLSRQYVINCLESGQLPGLKLGKIWRCHRKTIEELAKGNVKLASEQNAKIA